MASPSQILLASTPLGFTSAFPLPFNLKYSGMNHLSLRQVSIPLGPSFSLSRPGSIVQPLAAPAPSVADTVPTVVPEPSAVTLPAPVAVAPDAVPSLPVDAPAPIDASTSPENNVPPAPDVAAVPEPPTEPDASTLAENIVPPQPEFVDPNALPAEPTITAAPLDTVLPNDIPPADTPISEAPPAPEVPATPDIQTLVPSANFSPADNPPYQLYSLLSTPTTISFLLNDPNPSAPPGADGLASPVRCSATFANADGLMDMSQLPYDPQVCVDVTSGLPSTSSLWAWQVMDYAGPGLFVVRVWRGWLDPRSGPCAVKENGDPIFCNTNYYGEHQLDSSMGDMTCDPDALSCETTGIIEIPITSAVA